MSTLRAALEHWPLPISLQLALAVVATIGYLFGRGHRLLSHARTTRSEREIRRARSIAHKLEKITDSVHSGLAQHLARLRKFGERVAELENQTEETVRQDLCLEASGLLMPTLRLASQIALAYDEIRQASHQLMSLAEFRTDPLTGLASRRALDRFLTAQLALGKRFHADFCLAIFDVDGLEEFNEKEDFERGDRVLQKVAGLFRATVRKVDLVARFGGDEFAVVVPQTGIEGTCVLAERLRATIEAQTPLTASGGIARGLQGDTPESLTARALAALQQAKVAGGNCLFRHDGGDVKPVSATALAAVAMAISQSGGGLTAT
jgi:diguanylate cyclase (GGDEF)-like protein